MGPGAGLTSGVSPTGGYAAAVPLDLPAPRSPIPVPVSVVHTGSPRAGVAGVGWDVPLSYVRRSDDAWLRKPAAASAEPDAAPEQLTVVLAGAPTVMVRRADHYVPFVAGAYQELRETPTGWTLTTLDNLDYVFAPAATLGQGEVDDPDLWLLVAIRDRAGRDEVVLSYRTDGLDGDAADPACRRELRLASVAYTFTEPSVGKVPLYEVHLDYQPWWHAAHAGALDQVICQQPVSGGARALAFEHVRDHSLAFHRQRVLSGVRVLARDNHDPQAAPRRLRAYHLAYGEPDPATHQPRLRSVTTTGEEGTPEGDPTRALPVASYGYDDAVATAAGDSEPSLAYGERVEIGRFFIPGADYSPGLTTTVPERTELSMYVTVNGQRDVRPAGTRVKTRVRHVLRDFTGDGLPDLLYRVDNGDEWVWYLHANRLGASGPDLTMITASWGPGQGPAELQMSTTLQLNAEAYESTDARQQAMIVNETWTQFADWNGDGRLDVIDTSGGSDRNRWRVWLNQDVAGELRWRPEEVDVSTLRGWLEDRGYVQVHAMELDILEQDDWTTSLPLERSRTWHRFASSLTMRERYENWLEGWETLPEQPGDRTIEVASTETLTEWQLVDRNGDGFLDFAATSIPVRRHIEEQASCLLDWPVRTCTRLRSEWPESSTDCTGQCERGELWYALNRLGPFAASSRSPFGTPTVAGDSTVHGVSHWVALTTIEGEDLPPDTYGGPAEQFPPGMTWQAAGLGDRHGTGTLQMQAYPHDGGAVRFQSDRDTRCPDRVSYLTVQSGGMADLDGDGRADLLYPRAGWEISADDPAASYWWVRFATGAGFGPPRRLRAPADHRFALSESRAPCRAEEGEWPTHTTAGLTDMDGDGRPELLRVSSDGRLFMSRLRTAAGELGAGTRRLSTIDNGHGAVTTVHYGNRKLIGPRDGNVPAPEIVVTQVSTRITDGSAPDSAPTYYGYGQPEMHYDPVAGRWGFRGYRRHVTVTGTPSGHEGAVDGVISFIDRRAAAPPGSSYAEHVVGGQLRYAHQAARHGIHPSTIWAIVAGIGPLFDFAGSTPSHGVVPLKLAGPVFGPARYDCGDLEPSTADVAGTGLCGAAGLVYVRGTESWEGSAAPPATTNVLAGSSVVAEDIFGRPTRVHERGDLRRDDDDRCTTVTYAATSDGRPFPSVPSRIVVDDCGLGRSNVTPPPPPTVLGSTGYRYDDLPEGMVGRGLLTGRAMDRHGPGGYLDTIDAEHFAYGPYGRLRQARVTRVLGGPATRETTVAYDPFAATVVESRIDATGLPPRIATASMSTWTTRPSHVVEPTGVRTTVERDGHGRTVRTLVRPKAGVDTTIRRSSFDDAALRRRVVAEVFPVGAAPGTEDAAPDRQRVSTVLDALGRPRYQQRVLGGDYTEQTLVTGLVEYDPLGRVAFAAQPFPAPHSFDPVVLIELPYGSTTVYDVRGRVSRTVATYGRDEQTTASSEAGKTYVTSYAYGHAAGQAAVTVTGAAGNDPTAGDHTGVRAVSWSTATGRAVEDTIVDASGQLLDRVSRSYDRMERVVETRRHGGPGTPPVAWSATFDSLGRRLQYTEPGMSPQWATHDEDGNELESWWMDGGQRRVTRRSYDALGRLRERVLVRVPTAGAELVEATDRYHYDEPFGPHAPGAGAYLGRLSAVTTDGVGGVFYAYDELGRASTTTYDYAGEVPVREHAAYTVGGRLTELVLEAGATVDHVAYEYDSAARVRRVRDGAGPSTYFAAMTILPDGHYEDVLYGNGVREQFIREEDGRRQVHDWMATTASGFHWLHQDFDAAGRVRHERQETLSSVADLDYQYDPLGRLRQSVQIGGDNEGVEWFGHDTLGNLTARVATTPSGTREYTRDPADPDRLCRYAPLGSYGPCQFSYDGAGNVIEDTSLGEGFLERRKLAYDSGQRLTSISRGPVTAELTYGPLGRVATTVTGPTPRQVWSFGGLVEKRVRADGKAQLERRIPGPLGVIASLRHDGTDTAIVYTHGDSRANRFFTDADGRVVQATSYGPYGRVTGDSGAGAPLTYTDDLWNGGDDLRELGVVLLGPRAYDPEIGRFLQRDPIVHSFGSSTGNPYSFAFNDPVNFSDPTGLSPTASLTYYFVGGTGGFTLGLGGGLMVLGGLWISEQLAAGGRHLPRPPTAIPNPFMAIGQWAGGHLDDYIRRQRAYGPPTGFWAGVESVGDVGGDVYEVASDVLQEGAALTAEIGLPVVGGFVGCTANLWNGCVGGAIVGASLGAGAGHNIASIIRKDEPASVQELLVDTGIAMAEAGAGEGGGAAVFKAANAVDDLLTARKLLIQRNKEVGDRARDELAAALRNAGRDVEVEVGKATPFGRRVVDIEVALQGKVLGGIEVKVGQSRYHFAQRLKDWWLRRQEKPYIVDLVRVPSRSH